MASPAAGDRRGEERRVSGEQTSMKEEASAPGEAVLDRGPRSIAIAISIAIRNGVIAISPGRAWRTVP